MGYREVDSKCGIFVAHSLHDVYNGLLALQHRGEDTTGIAALTDKGIDVLRWKGKVSDFNRETAERILDGASIYMGEVRYSTRAGKSQSDLFEGALPRYLGGTITANYADSAHPHIIVRNANHSLVHNGNLYGVSSRGKDTDSDVLLKYLSLQDSDAVKNAINNFPAAFAAGYIDGRVKEAVVFTDRYGIRPLWIGRKAGKLIASSEDTAIKSIGGKPTRELESGELINIGNTGMNFDRFKVMQRNRRPCFFEWNYLGDEESSFGGIITREARGRLGFEIAQEYAPDVDMVSYVPNAPEPYALAYATTRGIDFEHIFYKVRKDRAFLGADDLARQDSIASNLHIHDDIELEGKRVLLLEDSIVRFNNAPDAVSKLRDKGASWIGLAVGTPPIGPEIKEVRHGCHFGIDMPPEDNFIVRRMDGDEMIAHAGLDDLHYISKGALQRGLRRKLTDCCAHCIGEPNPVIEEELLRLDGIVNKVYEDYSE